jgi:hypothetical protein
MQNSLIIDAHVHIYPLFDLSLAIKNSVLNFNASLSSDQKAETVKIWLLTERSDCHFFGRALENHVKDFSMERAAEETLLVRDVADNPVLYIFAGRQLISSDNLEVCALGTTFHLPDKKMTTLDTIRAVRDAGGLAAINWAPGKWFGERGKIVERLFEILNPKELFISDTTMRPTIWPTPKLMAEAQKSGFRILSGSDPLPFRGEENLIGSYAFMTSGEFEAARPASSLMAILNDDGNHFTVCGKRSGPVNFMRRQMKIMNEKKG